MVCRNEWISHLTKHECKRLFTATEETELIEWSQTQIDTHTLQQCLENNLWREKI